MNGHLRVATTLHLASLLALVAASFAEAHASIVIGSTIGLAALWIFAQQRSWRWGSDISLAGTLFLSVFGLFNEMDWLVALLALSLALAAWDLSNFGHRVLSAAFVRNPGRLLQRHVERLGVALGSAGLLSAIALNLEIRLSFAVAVSLVLILYLSVNQLIAKKAA